MFEVADSVWIILCMCLVMFMQVGFTCLEAGLTRSKNNINVAQKGFAGFAIAMFLFAAVGFSTMFGSSVGGWYGSSDHVFSIDADDSMLFLYQAMFLAVACALISGAVAERMTLKVYLLVVLIMSLVVYPVIGHWAWGTGGWLQDAGFYDMAGGSVVHSLGGAAALAAVLMVGPRHGRFETQDDGKVISVPVKESNLPLAIIGGLLLWIGWFGFTGGAHMGFTETTPHVLLVTLVAGAVGGTVVILLDTFGYHKGGGARFVSGALAGLVSIAACADIIQLPVAIMIAALAAVLMLCVQELMEHFAVDDAVGVVSVHLLPGVLGTLLVGVVSDEYSFEIQVQGVLAIVGTSFVVFYVFLYLLNRFIMPVRVSVDDEMRGMNISEHGERDEYNDLLVMMSNQAAAGNFGMRAQEESGTNAGEIALSYNMVLDQLESSFRQMMLQKRAMEQLYLEASNAQKRKSKFLSNMTHELRTPLNDILGMSELVRNTELDPTQESYMQAISSSGEMLLKLIENVLDMSKVDSGKMMLEEIPVEMKLVLENVISVVYPLYTAKNIDVTLEVNWEGRSQGVGDELRIQQVLFNLLSNAIKFTPDGSIHVSASVENEGDNVLLYTIRVKDDGIGIAEGKQADIFSSFVQSDVSTAREYGGNGLGLSICKELAELMGGDVTYESEPGKGSEFTFTCRLSKS
jgi:Amt family ammonium transporter